MYESEEVEGYERPNPKKRYIFVLLGVIIFMVCGAPGGQGQYPKHPHGSVLVQ